MKAWGDKIQNQALFPLACDGTSAEEPGSDGKELLHIGPQLYNVNKSFCFLHMKSQRKPDCPVRPVQINRASLGCHKHAI